MRNIPYETRLVPYGDKKTVALVTQCSTPGCGAEIEIHSSKASKILPPSMFGEKLRQKGWSVVGFKPYCPDHGAAAKRTEVKSNVIKAEEIFQPPPVAPAPPVAPPAAIIEKEKDEMIQKIPATVHDLSQLGAATAATMDAATKRRIYRAIDEHWNDDRGRYDGNTTDQLLSIQLNVPRAWVEEIRREVFGEDGGNAEIDQLKGDLQAAERRFAEIAAEASRRVDAAMEMVAQLEKCRNEVRDLTKRLERVEVAVRPRR